MQDSTRANFQVLNAQIFNTLALGAQRVAAVADSTSGSVSQVDQAVTQLFQVLLPSVANSVASLGGNSASQATNLSLTSVSTISNTLQSAVSGVSSSSSNTASNVANEAVTGILNTVSSLTSVLGRRLLYEGRAEAGRQLLQSTTNATTSVSVACAALLLQCLDLDSSSCPLL